MKEYNLIVSKRAENDIEKIIERKKEFGTYENNINKFLLEIDFCYERLENSPRSGSDLSTRVRRKTNKKYFVLDNRYLMIYEIYANNNVKVSRIIDGKSNWQRLNL